MLPVVTMCSISRRCVCNEIQSGQMKVDIILRISGEWDRSILISEHSTSHFVLNYRCSIFTIAIFARALILVLCLNIFMVITSKRYQMASFEVCDAVLASIG